MLMPEQARHARKRQERILVVDDSPTIRCFLVTALKEAGFVAIEEASSAEAAFSLLADRPYELVIVDKNLDPHDGFDVCRAARERAALPLGCMLVTGDTSVDGAARAVEEEIDAYLLKPLRKESVLRKVDRALQRVRLIRQHAEARTALEAAKATLERRTAELQRTVDRLVETQNQLAESDKQASIGMLAAGVAHEINNPACFILPNLDYLKRSARKLADLALEAGADVERVEDELTHSDRMVDRCLQGINRITQVVQTMRLFSRRDHSVPTAVDLNALCRSLLDLVTHELNGRAELDVQLTEVPRVEGHKRLLAQVVLSLLLNARRSILAAPDGGHHRIELKTEMSGERVMLRVSDSGPPLGDGDGAQQALEPFFGGDLTSGPGLHLTLARDILQRYGGELLLRSDAAGNRLEALLPVARSQTAEVDVP